MKCPKCNTNTIVSHPFIRMNRKGETGIFWCEPCAKRNEPELFNNQIEDEGEVVKFLKNEAYPRPNNQNDYKK